LIHLDELNSVALLADFAAVLVPGAVWDEVARHRPQALSSAHLPLERCAPARSARVEAVSALYTLHAGEIEALCQCTALPGALLLTDDTAARLAARTLGVTAHGTVGVLLRAIRRGQLPKDRALSLLRQIPDVTTLHLRPALLD
jgi:predicted nucleic acid-binding protein